MNYFDVLLARKLEDKRDPQVVGLSVTENGTYSEEGKVYKPVVVNVPLGSKSIIANGTYNASGDDLAGYSSVNVNVPLPSNAYLLKSVPNLPQAIANFTDGADDIPMKSLKVAIEPQQEGSGDPSPTNIRPISGWDEVDVNVSGVNVWDEEWENCTYANGVKTVNNNVIGCKNLIPIKPLSTLYFKTSFGSSALTRFISYYDKDKNYISGLSIYTDNGRVKLNDDQQFVVPQGAYYMAFSMGTAYGTTYNNDISINYPSTDTEYHAYNGQTYTIDLDGTHYGGEVDVVNGEGTDTLGYVDMGTLTWGYSVDYAFFYAGISNIKENTNNILCSQYKPIPYTQGLTEGAIRTTNTSVYVKDSNYTSASDFKTAMDGVQLVYELATPLTIQLTPTAIKSLDGVNNVYANTGDITDAEYFSKETE